MSRDLGVADRITWTGMLTGSAKWEAIAAAEVFALPSHQENFGIAVAESLAYGVPVLISRKVNIWREIAEDGAGLVEPDDAAGTARLLERWLAKSEAERDEMRRRAAACFDKRFDLHQTSQALLGVIGASGPRGLMWQPTATEPQELPLSGAEAGSP
jgi:glycosyltransferase involved in cell wall biosynthesis